MRRIIAIVLLIPLLVVFLVLGVVTFLPQQVLGWVNGSIDGMGISARTLDVGWWPTRLRADTLEVQILNAAGSPEQNWAVGRLEVQASVWDWMLGRPFWQIAAVDIEERQVPDLPGVTAPAPGSTSGDLQTQSEPLQIPALSSLLSFRQILIERLKLTDGTRADVRLDHEGSTLGIDLKVAQPSQTIVVQGTGEAQERLLIESDSINLDLNFDWQSPELGASGHLRNRLELQSEQALLIEFAPSRIDFKRGEEIVRGFDLVGGAMAWMFASDRLEINELAGVYTLAGDEQPYAMDLDVVADQLSNSPVLEVNYVFAQTDLYVRGQFEQPANKFSGQVTVNSEGLPQWLVTLPYHQDQIYPLEIVTEIAAGADAFSLNNLSVTSPRNQASGELAVRFPDADQSNWRVKGKFHAAQWLIPLVDAPIDPENAEKRAASGNQVEAEVATDVADVAAESPPDAQAEPMFTAQPVDWSWLDVADVDLQFSADQLDLQEAELADVQLNVTVKDGTARIVPLRAVIADGGLDVQAQLVKQADGSVAADLRYGLEGLSLDMFGVFPEGEVEGGRVSSTLQLTANGVSTLDLVNTLNGSAELMLYEMTIKNNMVDLVGSDLILETLNRLNPFKDPEPATQLQCAFLAFDVADGVIRSRDNLVVETLKMRIEAKAKIGLAQEDLDLTFSPEPKGGFGVGLTNVVKFVKLGGKLRSPGIEVDAMGLVNSGAAVGAALSTGGLSILAEGLVDRALGDSGCAQEVVTVELPAQTQTPTDDG